MKYARRGAGRRSSCGPSDRRGEWAVQDSGITPRTIHPFPARTLGPAYSGVIMRDEAPKMGRSRQEQRRIVSTADRHSIDMRLDCPLRLHYDGGELVSR